jgi:hypothetical protein
MAKNIDSNVGKNINSFSTSNIKKNNFIKLENIYSKLKEYNKKESSKLDKTIYKVTYEEIRHKFYDLSYEIYLQCFIDKPESELYDFIELQKNLLDIYNRCFDNPRKIEEYIKKMQTILFLRFPKRPIIESESLVWQNLSGKLNQNKNFKNKYSENVKYFLDFLKIELSNLKKNILDKIGKKINMINKLYQIYSEHNLIRTNPSFNEEFRVCYKIFLENIYDIAKDKKNIEEFLFYFEIFNEILASYGSYFGYPINSNNSNDKLLKEKIDELFKILKNFSENNSSKNTLSVVNLNNVSSVQSNSSFSYISSTQSNNSSGNLNNSGAISSDTKSIIKILEKKFMNNLNNKNSPIFIVYKNVSNKNSKEDAKLIYFSNKKIIRIGEEDYNFVRSFNDNYLFSSLDEGHLIIQENGNIYKLRYIGSESNIKETFILTKIENNVKWETCDYKNIKPIFDEILFSNNSNRSRVSNNTANFVRLKDMGYSPTEAAMTAVDKYHSNKQTWQNYPSNQAQQTWQNY